MIKKLLLFILINVFLLSYANADDEIGMTHEFGLSIPIYYQYQEPDFMYLEGDIKEEPLQSYGLTYNFKNAFLFGGYLNELEFDASWQDFNWDYWSDTSAHEGTGGEIINARILYGLQASDKMMIKTGFGYRYLDHQWAGKLAGTYDREQRNKYIPFIVELNTPIAGIDGKLKIEYDHMMYGQMKTASVGATKAGTMRNDDGFMWKTSYKFPYAGFYLEPYYEFMSLEDSNWDLDSCSCREPRNTTQEYGIKFTVLKKLGEDASVADNKRLLQPDVVNDFGDKFSFGIEYFLAELDTGVYGLTGTATLDEEDHGFSILSDFKITDFVSLETGFTNFGQAVLKGNNGDTFKVDGRWGQGTYAKGTTVSVGTDNLRNTFESYSGSLAIKPKFDFGNGNFVSADLGIHRWFQSEVYKFVASGGTTTMYSYAGWDNFYGIGAGTKKGDFEVSVNYKKYDMHYDATIMGASISYKF